MTVPGAELPLAAEFPAADRATWRGLVSAVLARSGIDAGTVDPELQLATETYDGFDLQPLYTAEDLPAGVSTGLPGHPPFVRGTRLVGAGATGWDVRQRHEGTDAARVNRAVLNDLENGATSVWLVLRPGGLTPADLPRTLAGVYLDLAPVALDAGSAVRAAAQELLSVADARGVDRAELRGTLGADPIGTMARTGTEPELAVLIDLAALVTDCPQLQVATVDATVYNDAGGSDSDEIAIATAVGVAYLRALTGTGAEAEPLLGLDAALARIEFRFAVSADQFSSIAKLRAARRVWARIGELAGATPELAGQRQHAVTSAAMLTRRDPWVNMLRTTIGCFAAAVGGAEAITVLPFDSAVGLPDDFGRRIARNTQSVLHDESSLARVIDPAGGSFYVESLTERLAEAAWAKFTEIERAGGAAAALQSGLIPRLLAATADARADAIAHRTDAITGVSEFAFLGEAPLDRAPTPPVDTSGALLPILRYAQDYEQLRDRSDAYLVRTGSRPKVLLVGLGPLAVHSGRMGFAANLFQAAGIEPVEARGNLEALLTQLSESAGPVPIVCLCSSDRIYAEQAASTAAAFRQAGTRKIYLAGTAGSRAESDAEAGITGYIHVGSNALELLRATLDELEVP